DRKSTRLNSSHVKTSYAVFCAKKTAQHFAQKPGVGVAGNAVDLVIARHDRADGGAADDLAERREEELAQLALGELGRGDVVAGFGLAVAGHVLERGEDFAGAQLVELAGAFLFFNGTAATEIYTLSLHDALPI